MDKARAAFIAAGAIHLAAALAWPAYAILDLGGCDGFGCFVVGQALMLVLATSFPAVAMQALAFAGRRTVAAGLQAGAGALSAAVGGVVLGLSAGGPSGHYPLVAGLLLAGGVLALLAAPLRLLGPPPPLPADGDAPQA